MRSRFLRASIFICLSLGAVRALDRTPVESSSLASVGYEAGARMLELEFKNGGIYRYRDVPREIFEGLMAATSKGHYFLERIRGKFDYERVREEKP